MNDDHEPQGQSHDQPASQSSSDASAGQNGQNGTPDGGQQGGGRRFDRNRRGGGGGRNPRGRRPFRNNRQDNRGPNDQGGQGGQGGQGEHGPGPDEFTEPVAGEAALHDGPPPEPTYAEGVVEVSGKGFGFLREAKRAYAATQNDIFITPEVIREFNLRDGVFIKGETRRGPRGIQLFRATEIEGEDPAKYVNIPYFEELTTISPNKRIKLETVPERFTTRVIDLMTPVGKGQRGLIVAPPRTGKTTLLQHIADAVVKNHPEVKLIILLVDERPEEVTEIRRTVPQAELYASSNDSDLRSHTRIAQIAIDRAKRLVEQGKDVFVLMDSLTRIGRAFNNAQGGGGRTMSGGMDSRAMEIPRKLFAAARNTEEAGSLTIMATALIETNSRMDDLIFQEFKGTGNMELVLDRKISDQRIYPAVDIFLSGTRREELLLNPEEMHKINIIRRGLAGHKPIEAIERLLFFIRRYPTNAELLKNIPG
jgi:transcription termination factor Rho